MAESPRVYDADLVDTHVEQLNARIAELEAEVAHLRAYGTDDPTDAERILGRAMLVAQQAADEAIAEANAERERILGAARSEARLIAPPPVSSPRPLRPEVTTFAPPLIRLPPPTGAPVIPSA